MCSIDLQRGDYLSFFEIGNRCLAYIFQHQICDQIRQWNRTDSSNKNNNNCSIFNFLDSQWYKCLNLACKGNAMSIQYQMKQGQLIAPDLSKMPNLNDILQCIFMKNASIDHFLVSSPVGLFTKLCQHLNAIMMHVLCISNLPSAQVLMQILYRYLCIGTINLGKQSLSQVAFCTFWDNFDTLMDLVLIKANDNNFVTQSLSDFNILGDLIGVYLVCQNRKKNAKYNYDTICDLSGMATKTLKVIIEDIGITDSNVDHTSKHIELKHQYSCQWSDFLWHIRDRINTILDDINRQSSVLLNKLTKFINNIIPVDLSENTTTELKKLLTKLSNTKQFPVFQVLYEDLQDIFVADQQVPVLIESYVEAVAFLSQFKRFDITHFDQVSDLVFPIILEHFHDTLLNDLNNPSRKTFPYIVGALSLKHIDSIQVFAHLTTYSIVPLFLLFELGYCDCKLSIINRHNRNNIKGGNVNINTKTTVPSLMINIESRYYSVVKKKEHTICKLPVRSLIKTLFKKYTLRQGNNLQLYDIFKDLHFTLIKVKCGVLVQHIGVSRTSLADTALYCSYDYMNTNQSCAR